VLAARGAGRTGCWPHGHTRLGVRDDGRRLLGGGGPADEEGQGRESGTLLAEIADSSSRVHPNQGLADQSFSLSLFLPSFFFMSGANSPMVLMMTPTQAWVMTL